MVRKTADCILEETIPLPVVEVLEYRELSEAVVVPNPPLKIYQPSVRTSLRASTLDGVFATIFGCVTTGALLTNFLLELGATSVEIGFLSSIPLFANLLQPLGAYLADRTTSRHWYGLWIFGLSRLLWIILLVLIAQFGDSHTGHHQLVIWTLGIILTSHILGALGGASWFSWMAALVPRRLRGRYFGIRNSAANLVNLICVPLMGLGVSTWAGGAIQGYGVILFFGIVAGLLSLIFQFFIRDVNPQEQMPESKGIGSADSAKPAPAQLTCMGGLPGLFALSAVLRLVALLPLVFLREHRSVRLNELMREMTLGIGALLLRSRKNVAFLPSRPQPVPIQAVELGNSIKIGSRE